MIDYGAAINSVQKSSKSELSSRFFGRLKFLVIFCLFVRYGRWSNHLIELVGPGSAAPAAGRGPTVSIKCKTKAFFPIFGGVLRTAAKNRKKCETKTFEVGLKLKFRS